MTASGHVEVHAGIASVGQGVDTILAQICAECLGVEYERVSVFHGDTSATPDGMGAFGSRATMLAGAALADASDRLRTRILEHAAIELEADEDDLDILEGRVMVVGAEDRAVGLEALHELARPLIALPRGLEPGLSEEAWFHCPDMSFPYGVHFAAVEVDAETGHVDISGTRSATTSALDQPHARARADRRWCSPGAGGARCSRSSCTTTTETLCRGRSWTTSRRPLK